MHALYVLTHRSINGLPMPHVGKVNDNLDQMFNLTATFFDELLNILHHLMRLLDRIMAVDVDGVIQALGALAP